MTESSGITAGWEFMSAWSGVSDAPGDLQGELLSLCAWRRLGCPGDSRGRWRPPWLPPTGVATSDRSTVIIQRVAGTSFTLSRMEKSFFPSPVTRSPAPNPKGRNQPCTGVPQTEYCLVLIRVCTSVLRSIDQSVY